MSQSPSVTPFPGRASDPDTTVAVIIPYFQRECGLLARAVRSALTQDRCAPHVFVVDDGSPVPAACELSLLSAEERERVTLITQPNAGPAAARNCALAQIPDNVTFIAFLDSDDTWESGHLANAAQAFNQGADIYFADHIREGASQSRFAECGLSAASGSRLESGDQLYRYRGDLFSVVLRKSPIGTPTLVFRRSIGAHLRFREDLRVGEDSLLWLFLIARSSFHAFSTRCDAKCGRGVNISAGAAWGTPQMLRVLADTAKMHRLAASSFPLTPDLRRWSSAWRRELRQSYVRNLLHLARRRSVIDWRSLAQYLGAEPILAFDLIHLGTRQLLNSRVPVAHAETKRKRSRMH